MKIGIFDSGIGGFTVLKHFLNKGEIIYLADHANMPYGNKNYIELHNLVLKILFWFEKYNPDIVIIACNTLDSILMDFYDNLPKFKFKIINIIQPTIDYIINNVSAKEKFGILATKKTVESNIFQNQLHHLDHILACDDLALLIEQHNIAAIENILPKYLQPFHGFDKILLGCTHYPLMLHLFQRILYTTSFFDQGLIIKNTIVNYHKVYSSKINFYTTSNNIDAFNSHIKHYLKLNIKALYTIL